MTNVELINTDETIETEHEEFELSLTELDLVGGGNVGSILQ